MGTLSRHLALVVLVGLLSAAPAQAHRFIRAFGGPDDDEANSAVLTSDGGVALTGYTESFGMGQKDVLVMKLSSCRRVLWARTLGGGDDEEGHSIIETFDGGLVIAGYTESFGGPGRNLLLSKFTASGEHAWSWVLNRPDGELEFTGYAVIEESSPAHNLVVTGTMHRNIAPLRDSVLFAVYDKDGVMSYMRTAYNPVFLSRSHRGRALAETPDGRFLVVGSVEGGEIDSNVLLVMLSPDPVLPEYNIDWSYMIGDPGVEEGGRAIIRSSDDGFVFAGAAGDDYFVSKLRPDLNIDWQKRAQTGASEAMAVCETVHSESGFVATGWHDGWTDVLLGKWTPPVGASPWLRSFGSPTGPEVGHAVLEDGHGYLWVAGYADSWWSVGGGKDVIVMRFDSDGAICVSDLGGPGSQDWDPAEDPEYLLWLFEPIETESDPWSPGIGDPDLVFGATCCDTDDSCVCSDLDVCTCDACENTPRVYGDVNCSGIVSLFDIFCILDLIAGEAPTDPYCTICNADIDPCEPNGVLSLFDIFGILDAIAGIDWCCTPGACCLGGDCINMDNREDCWDECKDRPDCEIEDEDFGFFENEDCASFTCPQPAAPQRASLDQASCRLLRRSWMPVEIKVVPAVGEVPPGGTVEFAVFATGAADVGGYEIKCATSGLLSGSASVVPSIQDRRDALFNGAESVSAVDPVGRRVLAVALSGGVSPARAAYLGTFTGRLSDDASGTLEVGLATGPEELIVADPDGRPYRVNVTPGTVRITPPSRGP